MIIPRTLSQILTGSSTLLWILNLSSFDLIFMTRTATSGLINATKCQPLVPTEDKMEFITCEDYIVDRIGCCPAIPVGNCDSIDGMGNVTGDVSKCRVPMSDCKQDRDNASIWECQMKLNPYRNQTIWDRSNFPVKSKLNEPCNTELYKKRMKKIWQTHLQCPHNPVIEIWYQELADDWNYNGELLDSLCVSQNIEECVNGTCKCFTEEFKNTAGNNYLNFTQIEEGGDRCGLLAGASCTFNKDAIVDIKFNPCHSEEPFNRTLVPKSYTCENNAACVLDFKTKQCLKQPCVCTCATSHTCKGSGCDTIVGNLGVISCLVVAAAVIKMY